LFGDVIEIPFRAPQIYKPYAEMDLSNIVGAMLFRRNLARAHPFLIGPATLECLLEKPVDNYDYISTGRLPFNPLFFEFTDKVPAIIPKVKRSEVTLQGVYLCANQAQQGLDYIFSSFWKDKKGEIMGIDLFMKDPRQTRFKGMVSHISQSNFELSETKFDRNRYSFVIDTDEDVIHISQTPKKEAALAYELHKNTGELVDFKKLFDISLPLSSVEHRIFEMIPSLATNLINYINAHNISIFTRTRFRPEIQNVPNVSKEYPYSIVKVTDAEYREPQTEHHGKVLTYQLAVRGHNRRLKDDAGIIRKVIWIDSYVKGPPGTPFYDTRHEVTAKKILAERELFREIK